MSVFAAPAGLDIAPKSVPWPVANIKPSPENDTLYRPVDPDDAEIRELAESIRREGVLDPLVITLDEYVLSGHRRLCAAKLAGLTVVPIRLAKVGRDDDLGRFVELLREFNRQRDKSLDEKLREQLVEVDPAEAHRNLRVERATRGEHSADTLDLGGYRGRKRISAAKHPMLAAVQRILKRLAEYLPLSDRKVHYELLNDPPLRHAAKPDSTYKNDRRSYQDLCDLLTRARLTGEVPMEAIADETRPVRLWKTHPDARSFLREELDGLLKGYWRDLMRSQPNHVEILCEKNTVRPILEPVASRFTVPLTTGRGYSSLPPRAEMADRFRRSGKERLVVLIVSDFDPEGEDIAASFGRSLRDDFGLGDAVEAVKVALTRDQAEERGLPKDAAAKLSSSRADRFIEENGENVWELEALGPQDLQDILTEAIESVIDVDLLNAEIDKEEEDAAFIKKARIKAVEALKAIET